MGILTPEQFFARHGRHRLRVLVVAAQPFVEARPLDLQREWADLEAALRGGAVPATLVRLHPPTLAGLERALRGCREEGVPPHVLHFAGHGEPDRLLFEDEIGDEAWAARDDIVALLAGAGVRVLVLNACHAASKDTIGFARAVHEAGAVDVAIGHQTPVPDGEALAFAGAFYRRLALGETVNAAFFAGREAMTSLDARLAVGLEGDGSFQLEAPGASAEVRAADGRPERFVVAGPARFFGRAQEALALGRWLADDAVRAVAVTGMGGIGKSSLARQVAERHAWRFPGGVVEATARLVFEAPTAAALLAQAAVGLRRPPTDQGPADDLQAHAASAPTLYLFDNLEDLADDELRALLRFAEELPPGSKALLTLRPAPAALADAPWLARLPLARGLGQAAAEACVVHLGLPHGLDLAQPPPGVAAGTTVAAWLAAATAGHPKMLELAVGLLATQGLDAARAALPAEAPGAETVALAQAAIEQSLGGLLQHSYDRLDGAGQAVLWLLPLLPTGTLTDAEGVALLAALEGKTEAMAAAWFEAGAASCVAAGLLARDGDLLGFHPTVARYAREHLLLSQEEIDRGLAALVRSARAYVQAHHADHPTMSRRLDHVLGVFERAWEEGDPPTRAVVAQAVGALGYALQGTGRWGAYGRWQARLGLAPESTRARAHRLFRDAVHATSLGRPGEGRALIGEALALQTRQGDRQARAASLHHLAQIEYRQGDLLRARGLLAEALALREAVADRRGQSASLHLLAQIEVAQGSPSEARRLLAKSLAFDAELGDRQGRAASLHLLAMIEESQGDLPAARRLLTESLALKEAVGDVQGTAASLALLARVAWDGGEPMEASRHIHAAIEGFEALGDPKGHAASLSFLARIEAAHGDLSDAADHLDAALEVHEALGDPQGKAAILHQRAQLERDRGDHGAARRLAGDALRLQDAVGDVRGRSASLHLLAEIELTQGRPAEAHRLVAEALALDEGLGDPRGRAASVHVLALIEEGQGNLDRARALEDEAMALRAAAGDRSGRGASLQLLARLAAREGRAAEADDLLAQALRVCEEAGDPWGRAGVLQQLAVIADGRGDLPTARRLLADAERGWDGHPAGRASTLQQLAGVELAAGDLRRARVLARQAARIFDELGAARGRAAALTVLARVEHARGDLAAATPLLREAQDLFQAVEDRQGLATATHTLAEIALGEGDLAAARRLQAAAAVGYEALGDRGGQAAALHLLAMIDFMGGDLRAARQGLEASLAAGGEAGDPQGRAASLVMLGQLRFALGERVAGLAQVREGAELLAAMGEGRAGQAEAIAAKLAAELAASSR